MTSRHSLILISAITAALAAPLAFAQDASATTQEHASAQATTPAMPTTAPAGDVGAMAATPATPPTTDSSAIGATPATPAPADSMASVKKVSWSQLDGDKDGKLTKTEAAAVQSLSKVFDQADANKDGALTADEYKAYLAMHGKKARGNSG